MNLEELNLNRNLTKFGGSNVDAITKSLNTSVPTGSGEQDAPNILTGTVITSCIVQSSGGPDRVELAPYVTSNTGVTLAEKIDALVAYKDNIAVVLINKDGIYGTVASFGDAAITNLGVSSTFIYKGIIQPVVFYGAVSSAGSITSLYSWTCTHLGTGSYRITHNLNSTFYTVNITPNTGHYRGMVTNVGVNSFDISFQQSSYDGTGLYTGEVAVDVGFYFSLFNNLP